MECEVDRKELLAAVKTCRPVANGRVKPIYGCVRMEFKDDVCLLQATSGMKAIQISVPMEGSDGSSVCCVNCDLLSSILSSPSGEKITLILGDVLIIKTKSSRHKLLLTDPKEFPSLSGPAKILAKTTGAILSNSIARVVYARTEDNASYALGGILFDIQRDGWNLVGTNGRQLSLCTVDRNRHDGESDSIMPGDDCRFLGNLLAEEEGEALVGSSASGSSLVVQCGSMMFWSRLLEGRFPRYQDVIPSDRPYEASCLVGPLLNGIHEASLYTAKEKRGVVFEFDEDNGLTISAELAEVGDTQVSVPVRYDGQPVKISLDPRLIANFLTPLPPGKSVLVKLNGPEDAPVIEADGGNYIGVIMPLVSD